MYQSYSHLCCSHCQDLRLRSRGAGLRQDAYGSPLTFSGGDSDTLMLALLRATYSGRNDAALAASVEQALPVQPAWLNFNRLRLRAERSVPIGAGVSAQLCGKGAHPPPPVPRLQTASRPLQPSRAAFPAPGPPPFISCTRSPALLPPTQMLACLEVTWRRAAGPPEGGGPGPVQARRQPWGAAPSQGGVIFGDLLPLTLH